MASSRKSTALAKNADAPQLAFDAPRADDRVIAVHGAREHNLKNVDLVIPRDKLVVFTGLSGSGKSSLAFDTIYAEGQRRYVESLSAYARQFLEMMQKPDVDQIDGLSPAISIEQKTTSKNPRSTVGTVTEIHDYMRLLWARVGVPYSPATGLPIESQTVSQMVDRVLTLPQGTRLYLLAPVVRGRRLLQVGALTRNKIIERDDAMTSVDQAVAKRRADKSGSPRYEIIFDHSTSTLICKYTGLLMPQPHSLCATANTGCAPLCKRAGANCGAFSHLFLTPDAHQYGSASRKLMWASPARSIINKISERVKRFSRRVPKRSSASVRIV
jgi:hypothetical protein